MNNSMETLCLGEKLRIRKCRNECETSARFSIKQKQSINKGEFESGR